MAELKVLLGDKYKDGMTLDEITAAFAGLDVVDKSTIGNVIDKGLFDKKTSELAEANKKIKALETAQQTGKSEQEKVLEGLKSQLESLQKDKTRSENKAKFLALGYEEALADETAAAFTDGDMEKVFANQKKFLDKREQDIKTQLLKDTPKPPAGNGGTDAGEYQKRIDEALASGNSALAVQLMTEQQMKEQKT